MADLESNELERSLLDTLQSSELAEVPGDLIDTFAGFPVASTLKKLASGVNSVRDYLFAKKVVRLVTKANVIPPRERQEQLSKLLVVPGERERFAEQLLLSLERLDDTRKASIMGNLSVGLMRGQITLLEYWRMNRAVEALSLDEEWPILNVLEEYKNTYYKDGRLIDENWRHEGVFRDMVNDKLGLDLSDGDLRSIVLRVNQTGLFGLLGWLAARPSARLRTCPMVLHAQTVHDVVANDGLTRRWTGAADPVEFKLNADWRRPGQLGRSVSKAAGYVVVSKRELIDGLLHTQKRSRRTDPVQSLKIRNRRLYGNSRFPRRRWSARNVRPYGARRVILPSNPFLPHSASPTSRPSSC